MYWLFITLLTSKLNYLLVSLAVAATAVAHCIRPFEKCAATTDRAICFDM